MRMIATILLVIFTLVQAGPLYNSLFSESIPIFMVDEEKIPEKVDPEKKSDAKDYFRLPVISLITSQQLTTTHLHTASALLFSCLEMQTPPPDFC